MLKTFLRAVLGAALRVLVERIHRARVRRAVASLDGCDFCGEAADYFVDVTPHAKVITSRLACFLCGDEAVRGGGARILMGADGRPIGHGH